MTNNSEIEQLLLALHAEEKEIFAEYTVACQKMKVKPDPLAVARYEAKIEILNSLIYDRIPMFLQRLQKSEQQTEK